MQTAAIDKQALIDTLLSHGVLTFGEFTLKSGRISPYFFNAGLLASGGALTALADSYAKILCQQKPADDNTLTLFGAAYKGIPLVAATAVALYERYGVDCAWGYNRKEVKTHGEGGQVVGAALAGKTVWVLDDVMTAGTAMREVVQLLTQQQAHLAGIVVALNRQERGQGKHSAMDELAAEFAVPVLSLLSMADIMSYLYERGQNQTLQAMQVYRQQFGV